MPSTFSIGGPQFSTSRRIDQTAMSTGAGAGVNDPTQHSALALDKALAVGGEIDMVAISLVAGRAYTFDVDDGAVPGASLDFVLTLVDANGRQVATNDDNSIDVGSVNVRDPRLEFTASDTGIYFLAVRQFGNSYVDNGFAFNSGYAGTGDYSLVVSTPGFPLSQVLSDGNNVRTFSNANQRVDAGAGNDVLTLAGGDDIAEGRSGRDTLFGGTGDDQLGGGTGNDTLDGGDEDDALFGGKGNDRLLGGDGNDDLAGERGRDALRGGDGNDALWGDADDDDLRGGAGDDFLRGGTGGDTLTGGLGADTFHFLPGEAEPGAVADLDRIRDFETVDVIDLTDLLQGGSLTFVDGPFTDANQVRVRDDRAPDGSGFQRVLVNLDGDTNAEVVILVDTKNFTLDAGDFLL